MSIKEILTDKLLSSARERRLTAMHLQKIEDNPLDAEDISMFEMFEREGWSHERRRAYIIACAKGETIDESVSYVAE